MEGINLATLSINVQTTGIQQAKSQVNGLTRNLQQSGNTSSQATHRISDAFNGLGQTIRTSINNTSIFGTTIGNLRGQLSSSQGATVLLQGAISGLTMALVNMAMQGIQNAIAGFKQFVSKGIELASNLTEVQNVLDTTFGANAEKVNEWSITTASAFGLTELQAKQFSSTMGAILNGMDITGEQAMNMSIQMAQLTGDMASFYNLGHEEAFNKIKSGITGETEPLKSLGIVMTETNLSAFALEQGLSKAYNQMSAQEKTILRYNYLIEQTKLAHGDFAKTQESYANATKNLENQVNSLGASLGSGLLPVLGKMKNDLATTLEKTKPVFEIIGKLVGGMLQTLYNLLEPCVMVLKVLLTVLEPIFNAVSKILDVALKAINLIGSGLAKAVNFFAEKMGLIQDNVGETAEYTTEKITDETKKTLGYVEDATEKWINDQMKDYEEKIRKRYGESGSLSNEIKIQKALARHEEELQKKADRTYKNYETMEQNRQKQIQKTNELLEKQSNLISKNSGTSTHKAYATGTLYHTGGYAMVGEAGRELVELPRGSKVYNNRQTESILNNNASSNSNNTFYVTIDAKNVQDFNDVINMCNGYKQTVRIS